MVKERQIHDLQRHSHCRASTYRDVSGPLAGTNFTLCTGTQQAIGRDWTGYRFHCGAAAKARFGNDFSQSYKGLSVRAPVMIETYIPHLDAGRDIYARVPDQCGRPRLARSPLFKHLSREGPEMTA